jgi:hypothetical protein
MSTGIRVVISVGLQGGREGEREGGWVSMSEVVFLVGLVGGRREGRREGGRAGIAVLRAGKGARLKEGESQTMDAVEERKGEREGGRKGRKAHLSCAVVKA